MVDRISGASKLYQLPYAISRGKRFWLPAAARGSARRASRDSPDGGANVVICDVSERGAELAQRARRVGSHSRAPTLPTAAHVERAVDTAADEFGALHGAINCAGIATAERVIGREGPQPLEHFAKVDRA